jgi:hypothetical protein
MIRSADKNQRFSQASHGGAVNFGLLHSEVLPGLADFMAPSVSGAAAREKRRGSLNKNTSDHHRKKLTMSASGQQEPELVRSLTAAFGGRADML